MKRYAPGELIKFAHDSYNPEIYRVIEYTGKIDSGDSYEFTAELVIDKNKKKPKIKKSSFRRPDSLFAISQDEEPDVRLTGPSDGPSYVSYSAPEPDAPDSVRYVIPASFTLTVPDSSYVSYDSLTSAPSDVSFQAKQPKLHTFWDNGDFVRARSQQVLKRTSVIEGDHESRDW